MQVNLNKFIEIKVANKQKLLNKSMKETKFTNDEHFLKVQGNIEVTYIHIFMLINHRC